MDTKQKPATPAQTTSQQCEINPGTPVAIVIRDTAQKVKLASVPSDKVVWKSEDELVVIKQLVREAQRYPRSDYPCVVLQAFPQDHERIRQIQGGVELMLTFEEVEQFIIALNAVGELQGKGQLYAILQSVPPKPKARREWWRNFNHNRNSRWRRRSFRCH